MISSRLQKLVFAGSSQITEYFPKSGAAFLDATVKPFLGSSSIGKILSSQNLKQLKKVSQFQKILVIPDTHIGDTVMMQAASTALRDFFPEAEIHYVTNRTATPLVEGNPEISKIIPLFSGGLFPKPEDILFLKGLVQTEKYDLCLNLCAFIQNKAIAANQTAILHLTSQTPKIVQNEDDPSQINHFLYQCYRFIRDSLSQVAQPVRPDFLAGVRTTYSDSAIELAHQHLAKFGVQPHHKVVMVNPDTACEFTQLPFDRQAELLGRISDLDAKILIGAGHTAKGIGQRLIATLSSESQRQVALIPNELSLEVYSALIDAADVFITGDTGPMHIAASRRFSKSGKHRFRNQTSVLSIFGATPPRMSGYDSFQPGYLPPHQDAPSWSYAAGSACRNITCLNKMFKTCSQVRCFETVDIAYLSNLVADRLKEVHKPSAPRKTHLNSLAEISPT